MNRSHASRRWLPALLAAGALLLGGCGREPAGTGGHEIAAAKGSTLARIRARGTLNCAIHTGQLGMSYLDKRGRWQGFFVDYCRALAAAVLGAAGGDRFVIGDQVDLAAHEVITTWRDRLPVALGAGTTQA